MPRLYIRGLCADHAACLQSAIQLLITGSYATQALVRTVPAIPAQWREGFAATAPVPAAASDNTTAFSWAKKQMPGMPLSLLGKYFKLRQVRVLQGDQVKRVPRTRNLVPGDILLLPKDLPEAMTGSSRTAAAAQAAACDSASSWEDEVSESLLQQQHQQQQHQQQQHQHQQQEQQHQQMRQMQQQDSALAQSEHLQQEHSQQRQQQQQEQQLQDTEEVIELDQHWLQQQLSTSADVLQSHRHKQHNQKSFVEWPAKQIAKHQHHHHQQQQQQGLTVQQIRRWMLASSQDIAIVNKPPGVSFMGSSSSSSSSGTAAAGRQLHPVLLEALGTDPPDTPKLLAGLDVQESGAVVFSRNAAAHQWLSAWIAGEPAAVAAAAAAFNTDKDGSSRSSRGRQRQKKLKRLVSAAAAVEDGGSSSHGVPVYTAREVAGLQQLMMAVGGLRLRRVFWAVVQGRLPVRQTGTLRNRMLRGELSLPSVTRYKVLASTEGLSWLELQPLTNRRNQIRVHCGKTLGAPIVGDYRYGYRPWTASSAVEPRLASYQARSAASGSTQGAAGGAELEVGEMSSGEHVDAHGARHHPDEPHMLHCREIVLLRPRKPPVRVIAPLPVAMKQLLQKMGWT